MNPRRHKFALMLAFAGLLTSFAVEAQSPEKLSYQAVVRDADGILLPDQIVGMRIEILQSSASGASVYAETHAPSTNANGLVSLEVGEGNVVSGTFSSIDWSDGPFFLKTEIDPNGGTSYSITGTTQLMSVPYALHANTVGTEADPAFTASPAAGITGTNITNWNTAYGWGNTHGNITSDGKIGTAAGRIITTGTGGTLQATAGTAAGQMLYWNGTAWVNVQPGGNGQVLTLVNGVPTWAGTIPEVVPNVVNPTTGKIWMDRNVGATQVATAINNHTSYGHLYQWGRGTDGHQLRTSATSTTASGSDTPGHDNFIIGADWRDPMNLNLWQGASGINNPCPTGYRLPTDGEWEAERLSWSSNNVGGAFDSPLKLPGAGYRLHGNGALAMTGTTGLYWSGTAGNLYSGYLYFSNSEAFVASHFRGNGFSVRCIQD